MLKRFVFFGLSLFLLFSCSKKYYYSSNPRRFLPSDSLLRDTFRTYKYVRSDTEQMVFIETTTKFADTIETISYTIDSTFFDVSDYVLDSSALRLYSEFYAFNRSILFFNIKKDIAFGLNPRKTGYMNILKVLDAPQFYQKIRLKSIGSVLDTVKFGDTTVQVLRVDVRNFMVFKDKTTKRKYRAHQILHFYYYPGYGQIMVKGKGYEERSLKQIN